MKKIEIMRPDATITVEGKRHEITGRSAEVFRVLVLSAGSTVSMASIAEIRETDVDAVRGKVRDLRKQLERSGSGDLIENDHGTGYRSKLDGWWVDAHEFRKAIEPLKGGFGMNANLYQTADEAREDIRKLEEALKLWRDNPAGKLPVEFDFGPMFDALRARAVDRLLMARLHSRQHDQIREAIQLLEHRCRSTETADDATWELRLLAYHAIGLAAQVSASWEDLAKHDRARTARLSRLMAQLNERTFVNPFQVDRGEPANRPSVTTSERPPADDQSLQSICEVLGITTSSRMRLLDSQLTPKACISRARYRLYFSGVLASKWVIEPAIRSHFDQLLSRFDAEGGEAKFLMINPKGDSFKRLCELRKGNISLESVGPLKDLAARHKSLEVRAYEGLPAFRIVVIDDDVVSFSPYRLAADAYLATDRGWEAPHVVLDPVARYPLAEAFKLLFEETWKTSVPLGDLT